MKYKLLKKMSNNKCNYVREMSAYELLEGKYDHHTNKFRLVLCRETLAYLLQRELKTRTVNKV
jgi:hypothetical protein